MASNGFGRFGIKDLIAVIVIIGGIILLLAGHNGWIQGIMALIIGYYFVKRTEGKDNGH